MNRTTNPTREDLLGVAAVCGVYALAFGLLLNLVRVLSTVAGRLDSSWQLASQGMLP